MISDFFRSKTKNINMIIMIAAVAENNALGKNNELVWHLPNDFKRFKELTSGHYIIMGRKTFESFPKDVLLSTVSKTLSKPVLKTRLFTLLAEERFTIKRLLFQIKSKLPKYTEILKRMPFSQILICLNGI
ncbi:MAG: hypothetical protein RL074_318 [Bacteroidota bacterium]